MTPTILIPISITFVLFAFLLWAVAPAEEDGLGIPVLLGAVITNIAWILWILG